MDRLAWSISVLDSLTYCPADTCPGSYKYADYTVNHNGTKLEMQ